MRTTKNILYCLSYLLLLAIIASCSHRVKPTQNKSTGQDTTVSKDSAATQPVATEIDYTYEQRQGKYLYAKYCAVCHGEEGKGDGFNAFNLNPKPRDFSDSTYMSALTDQKIEETIAQGGRGVGKSPQMPSWGGRLTKAEVLYLTDYVRVFSGR